MSGQFSRAYALVVVVVGLVGSTSVMAIAMGTSYGTQTGWLQDNGVARIFAHAIPLTVDVLALMSMLALKLPKLPEIPGVKFHRWPLWFIFVVTLGVSAWWNLAAGKGWIDSTAHVWVVIAYLMAEYLANWILRYWLTLKQLAKTAEAAKQVAVTEVRADDAQAEDLPEAPVSPAVPSAPTPAGSKARKRGPYGPRDPERGYAPSTVRKQRAQAKQAQPVA